MIRPLDRVWRVYEEGTRVRQDVGTVLVVSREGYTTVLWDDGAKEIFRPNSDLIRAVEGEDTLRRHDWFERFPETPNIQAVWQCRRCGVEQTDENEFASCVSE
jgi:hypothetical protein